jgi:hypothetical protein
MTAIGAFQTYASVSGWRDAEAVYFPHFARCGHSPVADYAEI